MADFHVNLVHDLTHVGHQFSVRAVSIQKVFGEMIVVSVDDQRVLRLTNLTNATLISVLTLADDVREIVASDTMETIFAISHNNEIIALNSDGSVKATTERIDYTIRKIVAATDDKLYWIGGRCLLCWDLISQSMLRVVDEVHTDLSFSIAPTFVSIIDHNQKMLLAVVGAVDGKIKVSRSLKGFPAVSYTTFDYCMRTDTLAFVDNQSGHLCLDIRGDSVIRIMSVVESAILIRFCHDGRCLIIVNGLGDICIYQIDDIQHPLWEIKIGDYITTADFSGESGVLAIGTLSGSLFVYRVLEDGLQPIGHANSGVASAAWVSSDTMVIMCYDGNLKTYDACSRQLSTMPSSINPQEGLSFVEATVTGDVITVGRDGSLQCLAPPYVLPSWYRTATGEHVSFILSINNRSQLLLFFINGKCEVVGVDANHVCSIRTAEQGFADFFVGAGVISDRLIMSLCYESDHEAPVIYIRRSPEFDIVSQYSVDELKEGFLSACAVYGTRLVIAYELFGDQESSEEYRLATYQQKESGFVRQVDVSMPCKVIRLWSIPRWMLWICICSDNIVRTARFGFESTWTELNLPRRQWRHFAVSPDYHRVALLAEQESFAVLERESVISK